MPKVGELEFEYTEEGMEAAKQYAKSTNKKIEGMEGTYPASDARNRKKVTMGYSGDDNPYENLK